MLDEGSLSLRPLGLSGLSEASGSGWTLAGGSLQFARVEAVVRRGETIIARAILAPHELSAWAEEEGLEAEAASSLSYLTRARPNFAGLPMSEPVVMGIINATPDSFSDGGDHFDTARAIEGGLAMWAAGARILDVGGESTRPGAEPVPREEELRRVIPVIKALVSEGARVSIDTRHAGVMAAALEAGAAIINDVTALTGDPESLEVVAKSGAPIILMHMLGDPQTMQKDPSYSEAALDIHDYLGARLIACEDAGIERSRICLDPGIGFGKTLAHNMQILEQLAVFHDLGCPILLGASRKAFISKISEAPAKERLGGSIAAALAGVARGVQILRVHDVRETVQALAVWQQIATSPALGSDRGSDLKSSGDNS